MSADATRHAIPSGKYAVALGLFAAVILVQSAGNAGPRRSEIEHRQQMLDNSAEAANQRTLQQRDIADRQKQLLEYQVRKAKRMQLKMQCKAAGGGLAC
jgi:hypothetical protein